MSKNEYVFIDNRGGSSFREGVPDYDDRSLLEVIQEWVEFNWDGQCKAEECFGFSSDYTLKTGEQSKSFNIVWKSDNV